MRRTGCCAARIASVGAIRTRGACEREVKNAPAPLLTFALLFSTVHMMATEPLQVRQFQETVINMREEAERYAAAYQDEIAQLTATIRAMRGEMERIQASRQDAIQQAIADASLEI